MKKYLGVKVISAEPMSKEEFEALKNKSEVFYGNSMTEGYKVVYADGYESWSPKDVFEEAYREIDNLTFGLAVEALKKGNKVARKGWNGKGVYIYRAVMDYQTEEGEIKEFEPCIVMFTADKKFQPGWLASQTDILAEDWEIID